MADEDEDVPKSVDDLVSEIEPSDDADDIDLAAKYGWDEGDVDVTAGSEDEDETKK